MDESNRERVRENLRRRLKKFVSVFRNQALSGNLYDDRYSLALKRSFTVSAQETAPSNHLAGLDDLSNEELDYLLILGKRATFFAQPLYVGITVEQTLQQRYSQHYRDFNNSDELNVFGTRLRKSGIRWEDILFTCADLPLANVSSSGLLFLETQIHAMHPPLFSIR
ncbi:hypothetical protein [Burkholderia anthina]|uniref:hypothetical protein n=1 Tax=Burkholderia anthina TaxID=179879 RepID=UPI00158CC545|nr:hypothetical protein [Burkholderia anthina]